MRNNHNAFTMTEIMVVIILLSILAAFGLPNYNNSREKAKETDILSSLRLIYWAMENYNTRNNGYPTASMSDVDEVNDVLEINVVTQNLGVSCNSASGPGSFACTGSGGNPVFSINITDTNDGDPVCGAVACPSRAAFASY